jgi:hypothetical protein
MGRLGQKMKVVGSDEKVNAQEQGSPRGPEGVVGFAGFGGFAGLSSHR